MGKLEKNSVTDMIDQGLDLLPRWKEILEEIALVSGFVPDKDLLRKSEWWKTGKIGAVHCPGVLTEGKTKKRAVLKIQGTRPQTSEVTMIKAFKRQNKSDILRPPEIYWFSPWSEERQYESFIMEETEGSPVIVNHPATNKELDNFFNLYKEYRKNCIGTPWIKRPKTLSYRESVTKWMKATEELRKIDPLKEPGDLKLAEKGIVILEKSFGFQDLEFMHGHFQPGDLIVSPSGEVVLFSNLFWSWRSPFYDAVFGYHWWILGTEHAGNFSEKLLETEREHWLNKIYALPEVKERPNGGRLLDLALLERAIPALMVDRYLLDQTKISAGIITRAARKELKRILRELS